MSSSRGDRAFDTMVEALKTIAEWKDFPATDKFWDAEKKSPMTYGQAYGSNGERDFMRKVAFDAIKKVAKL